MTASNDPLATLYLYPPGTIVLFSGPWSDRASRWIRIGTWSRWTHVGGVCWVDRDALVSCNLLRLARGQAVLPVDLDAFEPGVYLYEATTLARRPCVLQCEPVSGVQFHRVDDRLADYQVAAVRRLKTPLAGDESKRLTSLALARIGTRYDYRGALVSATWAWKHLWGRRTAHNTAKLYCAEYVIDTLQWAAKLRLTQEETPGTVTPRGCAEWKPCLFQPLDYVRGAA